MGDAVSCAGLENYQVQVRTAAHSWIADVPKAADGDGLGPSPFELLLGSLGACTVITVGHYAALGKVPVEKITCDVEGDDDEETKTYAIKVVVRVRGDLNDKDMKRLESYAKRCHVHQLLEKAAHIDVRLEAV